MVSPFTEEEKKELKKHLTVKDEEMKLSYFEYKQLNCLYRILESLVHIAQTLNSFSMSRGKERF